MSLLYMSLFVPLTKNYVRMQQKKFGLSLCHDSFFFLNNEEMLEKLCAKIYISLYLSQKSFGNFYHLQTIFLIIP